MSDDTEDTKEAEMVDTCAHCDKLLRTLDELSAGLCETCAEAEE